MSPDSILQYSQALSNQYTDWHPPFMAAMWHIFVRFHSPSPMLILQVGILWISLALIVKSLKEVRGAKYIYLVGLVPWVSNFSGVIWKDVWMADLFLAVFAAITLSEKKERLSKRLLLYISIFLSIVAILFRHNAIFSALPFFIYFATEKSKKNSLGARYRFVFVAIFCLFLLGFSLIVRNVIDYKILNAKKTYPENAFMIDDLSYLSIKQNRSLIPGISFDSIESCSDYLSGLDPYSGKISCLQKQSDWISSNLSQKSLSIFWIKQIMKNPISYTKFRILNFSYFIKSPGDKPWYIWQTGIDGNNYGLKVSNNSFSKLNRVWVAASAYVLPWIFCPFFWLCLNIYLLFYLRRHYFKYKDKISTLLFSSILNFISLFFGEGGADFRYIYWSVMACTLASFIIFLYRQRITRLSIRRIFGIDVIRALLPLLLIVIASLHRILM